MYVDCRECPLRRSVEFRPLEGADLEFVRSIKIDQKAFPRRTELFHSGQTLDTVFTLYSGWAIRYAGLDQRSRQIFDVLLPGDLIGLQASMTGGIRHSVRSITDVSICVHDGQRFRTMFERRPELAEALMATLLLEEQRADARLMLLGQQRPLARLAFLFLELRERLTRRGFISDSTFELPLTYEELADIVGISRSQVGASLIELRERRWAQLSGRTLTIWDREAMERWCNYQTLGDPAMRALI